MRPWESLTDEQRGQGPRAAEGPREKDLQKIAGELGVTDEQQEDRAGPGRTREEVPRTGRQGRRGVEQYHQQRHEFYAAIRDVLTEEQRAQLPGVLARNTTSGVTRRPGVSTQGHGGRTGPERRAEVQAKKITRSTTRRRSSRRPSSSSSAQENTPRWTRCSPTSSARRCRSCGRNERQA